MLHVGFPDQSHRGQPGPVTFLPGPFLASVYMPESLPQLTPEHASALHWPCFCHAHTAPRCTRERHMLLLQVAVTPDGLCCPPAGTRHWALSRFHSADKATWTRPCRPHPLRLPHLLQEAQLLQLPLVVQNETVAPGPPACQVLLAPDVGHGCVQDSPAPALHTWTEDADTSSRPDGRLLLPPTLEVRPPLKLPPLWGEDEFPLVLGPPWDPKSHAGPLQRKLSSPVSRGHLGCALGTRGSQQA